MKQLDQRAVSITVSLYPAEVYELDRLGQVWGCGRSDVVRRLMLAQPPGLGSLPLGIVAPEHQIVDDHRPDPPAICAHPEPVKSKAGLWRCDACGKVSNDRGQTWRTP